MHGPADVLHAMVIKVLPHYSSLTCKASGGPGTISQPGSEAVEPEGKRAKILTEVVPWVAFL